MRSGLKLRGRILTGYAVPVAIAITVAMGVTGGVWRTTQLEAELARRNDVATGMQNAAFKLAVNQRLTRGNVIAAGRDRTRLEDFRQNADIIQKFIAEATTQVQDADQQAKLQEIQTLVAAVLTLEDEINVRVMSGQREAAILAVAGDRDTPSQTRQLSRQLDTLIADFQTRQTELVTASESQLRNTLILLTSLTIIAALISVGLSGLIGFTIASRITNSLHQTVIEVDAASTAIATSIAQQEQAISQQAIAVDETTNTVEVLQSAARQVAEQARAAATGTEQTLRLVADGTGTAQATQNSIQILEQQVSAIATEIQKLAQQTREISTISSLVEDIAAQTHILSLNAAIEASRLGQQGAGFAIIARQIRELAEQSRASAEQIGQITQSIQTSIQQTDTTSRDGKVKALAGVGLTERTANAFNDIALAIELVTTSSQKIALDNQQQSTGMQQVTIAMNLLNQGAKEVVNSTGQIKSALHNLTACLQRLKTQI